MPRQKFTFKKSVSQPRDEVIKDTNSNLVQPTHSDELDVNELDESHDEEEDSGDGEEGGADAESAPREESEAGEGVALDDDDVDSVDQDAIPRRKVQVDNKIALERIRDTIKLDQSLPWTETLTVSFPETIDVDVDDDLGRELAFYKQALHGAKAARALAAEHSLPFTRPDDFFAEMVKTDAHMERIRQRLLDESAGIAKSEARRREREGKKIGKQVQLEKLKERERSKKDMDERLKGLKRKHKGALHNAQADGDEAFDVAVEDAIADRRPAKRARGGKAGDSLPRHVRDKKFGFGGHGKRDKQNTRSSTDDFDASARRGSSGGMRGRGRGRGGKGHSRLGKSRRVVARSRS
ncbi:eukaryotic rRNA processing protein EBP2-domain-containing protein [Russula ochroleuca]|uniref:Eukaryotic rRNA processing protein EBP2-domain-containing protein n=1 Tax=Russula ochroleuca TaxID=152965 RepID=A0A9P5MSA0_9AGAM|nr:eukaryotic rRNA processing protein EBP2-domain-containing protein [Russula ochroleuca]